LQAGREDKENDYVHQYSLDRLQQLITPAFESARRSPEKLSAVSRRRRRHSCVSSMAVEVLCLG